MSAVRSTKAARRAAAVDSGMRVFAEQGLTGAAIQRVADEIGVSQPYVFRLFGSKQAFFLACLDEMEDRVCKAFQQAAGAVQGDPMQAMGDAFRDLVSDGVVSGLWLQACGVARGDETVAARCRTFVSTMLRESQRLTGAGPEALAHFLASGALVMMLQAVGLDLTRGSQGAVADVLRAEAEAEAGAGSEPEPEADVEMETGGTAA